MIKINKGEKPKILHDNSDVWVDDLLGYIHRNEKVPPALGSKYNHPEIKEALKKETNSKCMYCESKVGHVSYEHIEHIRPKAKEKYPELTFDWDNLGLACPKCNMNKSDEFDPFLPLLNPYVDQPSEYLFAAGPYIYGRPGAARGQLTEKLLDLNRVELIEQRLERIEAIRQLMDSYEKEQNLTLKKLILKELLKELGVDKAYSFVTNSMVKIVDLEAA
ncbi:HNH endonuclease [Paenalcaligenes sp.]|uniref:HNH endonuclease n=1 Tax=Paenalcaligenes sp. TaxID=1966342 RepID=UPI0026016C2F|nr:HNH endonuclease [Paenalcaligenes sp.]